MKKPFFILAVLLTALSACHHESTPTINTLSQTATQTPDGGVAASIPSGAAGAFYAINKTVYTNTSPSGTDTTVSGLAYAWLTDSTSTANGGTIWADSTGLYVVNPVTNATYPWYETLSSNPISYSGSSVAWNVQGNSANNIPAISFTDNAAFPVVTGLSLPNPLIYKNSLTVNFNVSGAYDQIFFSITGSHGQTLHFEGIKGATSVTFTSPQIAAVIGSGATLTVEVMPVKLTAYSVSGSTYYFVKEGVYQVVTPL